MNGILTLNSFCFPYHFISSTVPTLLPSTSPSISTAPSESPTLGQCLITPEERETQILQLLDAVADPALIRNQFSPQGRATAWLINQDVRVACPNDKIVQRWVLALMYYSTGGDNWRQCSSAGSDPCGTQTPFGNKRRFLSSFNECDWAGITCNVDACATEVEFENNNLIGSTFEFVSSCLISQ